MGSQYRKMFEIRQQRTELHKHLIFHVFTQFIEGVS